MKIIIASNNAKKSRELQNILKQENIETILQSKFNIDSVEETGLTFVENAILKARHAARLTSMPAIADDSGIEVEALDNRPGIYSARYAGNSATDNDGNEKLLSELRDLPESKRTARYKCVMVFLKKADDPTPIICQGTWKGEISFAPKGKNGFGYDPIFFLPTYNCTAAEISPELKNKISHRARATQKLITCLKNE